MGFEETLKIWGKYLRSTFKSLDFFFGNRYPLVNNVFGNNTGGHYLD